MRNVVYMACLTIWLSHPEKSVSSNSLLEIFDSDHQELIYGLLTGCEGHTEKYRTAIFVQPELARAVLKDQGPVFLSMARANPVNKPFMK